jgi:hypothetical protein
MHFVALNTKYIEMTDILCGPQTLKRQCANNYLLFLSVNAAQEKEKKRRKSCCPLVFQSL